MPANWQTRSCCAICETGTCAYSACQGKFRKHLRDVSPEGFPSRDPVGCWRSLPGICREAPPSSSSACRDVVRALSCMQCCARSQLDHGPYHHGFQMNPGSRSWLPNPFRGVCASNQLDYGLREYKKHSKIGKHRQIRPLSRGPVRGRLWRSVSDDRELAKNNRTFQKHV